MERNWGSFFVEVFKKSPVVATCMLIGVGVGALYGIYLVTGVPPEGRRLARVLFYFVCGMSIVGGFVGLIAGVIADYAIGLFRDDKPKKKKKKKRRPSTPV